MELVYRALHHSCILSKILALFMGIHISDFIPAVLSASIDYNDNKIPTDGDLGSYAGYVDSDEQKRLPLPFDLSDDPMDVHFYLYRDARNLNSSQELIYDDTESIQNSLFNPKTRTVFLIHGFWSNSSSPTPLTIKDAYLREGFPYNVIVVDWGRLSTPIPRLGLYSPLAYTVIVKKSLPIVYRKVAGFIQFLITNHYTSLDRLHIIGHSLGAHIAGGAGYTLAHFPENHGKKVARVTGLDPAGPLFQGIRLQRRLQKGDADFVDVYHTAAGTLGNKVYREGNIDFFPNGGHHQPGCVDEDFPFWESEFGSCSHSFVAKIYAASISKKFIACQCDPRFVDYVIGTVCLGNCTVTVLAGEPCPSSAKGQFYFVTSANPFAD